MFYAPSSQSSPGSLEEISVPISEMYRAIESHLVTISAKHFQKSPAKSRAIFYPLCCAFKHHVMGNRIYIVHCHDARGSAQLIFLPTMPHCMGHLGQWVVALLMCCHTLWFSEPQNRCPLGPRYNGHGILEHSLRSATCNAAVCSASGARLSRHVGGLAQWMSFGLTPQCAS